MGVPTMGAQIERDEDSSIRQSLQSLLDAGAQIEQEINDVGGGALIASAKDADGNIIGLRQG